MSPRNIFRWGDQIVPFMKRIVRVVPPFQLLESRQVDSKDVLGTVIVPLHV
jgi:hypothetical protein